MKLDFITLGETLIRFMPPGAQRLETAAQVGTFVVGAESNVAAALARLGKRAAWVSRLPNNPLGRLVANTLHLHGVDTDAITWVDGERQALMFVESGASPRPTRVWYDRANSAASSMSPDDLPVELLQSARWLHLTGITPALSPSCRETAHAALDIAQQHGLTISFDVNYRAMLWSPEEAAAALEPFCQAAHIVFTAARDAKNLFGVEGEKTPRILHERWGGTVIVSQGDADVIAYDGETNAASDAFSVEMVDRLGAGDALAAGVICRLMEDAPLEDALQFGSALAALKLTIPGDIAIVSRPEVEELLRNRGGTLHR